MMNTKDIILMDKILRFENDHGKDWMHYDNFKSKLLNELTINPDRYQIYINEISKFSETVTPICHTYRPHADKSYPKFDCDESTNKFIEEGGFAGYFKIKKPMYNLDEILSEYLDVLAAHYPGGIRPKFDFFNDKPYDYLSNAIIEKAEKEGLAEWRGTIMVLSTEGYELIQKNGSYINSLGNQKFHNENLRTILTKEFDERLSKMSEGILRNEMGAEIIFDELQELKEMINVLNKKNWEQLLKGKLIDLATNKAVGLSVVTAKHIFFDLTGKSLDKLLSP